MTMGITPRSSAPLLPIEQAAQALKNTFSPLSQAGAGLAVRLAGYDNPSKPDLKTATLFTEQKLRALQTLYSTPEVQQKLQKLGTEVKRYRELTGSDVSIAIAALNPSSPFLATNGNLTVTQDRMLPLELTHAPDRGLSSYVKKSSDGRTELVDPNIILSNELGEMTDTLSITNHLVSGKMDLIDAQLAAGTVLSAFPAQQVTIAADQTQLNIARQRYGDGFTKLNAADRESKLNEAIAQASDESIIATFNGIVRETPFSATTGLNAYRNGTTFGYDAKTNKYLEVPSPRSLDPRDLGPVTRQNKLVITQNKLNLPEFSEDYIRVLAQQKVDDTFGKGRFRVVLNRDTTLPGADPSKPEQYFTIEKASGPATPLQWPPLGLANPSIWPLKR